MFWKNATSTKVRRDLFTSSLSLSLSLSLSQILFTSALFYFTLARRWQLGTETDRCTEYFKDSTYRRIERRIGRWVQVPRLQEAISQFSSLTLSSSLCYSPRRNRIFPETGVASVVGTASSAASTSMSSKNFQNRFSRETSPFGVLSASVWVYVYRTYIR